MQALHLTADLYRCRCDAAWLTDPAGLRDACLALVAASGFAPAGELFVAPNGEGVAGTVVMAQAQLSLRTCPAQRSAFLDIWVAGPAASQRQARGLLDALLGLYAPEWTEQRSLDRGDES